jgi:ribosome-associated protein
VSEGATLFMTPQIDISENELRFSFVRSSGPGGQNVNKLNTKAILRWSPTRSQNLPEEVRQRFLMRYGRRITADGEIIISSQRFREQKQNARDCREKLRELIAAVAVAPKRRKPSRPTKGSVQRRRTKKRIHSQKKQQRRGLPPED